MNSLRQCPCCKSEVQLIDIPVAGDVLWQVACKRCGLATELDDDKGFCVQRWNRRDTEERLRTMNTGLWVLAPFLLIGGFLTGMLVGLNFSV